MSPRWWTRCIRSARGDPLTANARIRIAFSPPEHGWLRLSLDVDGTHVDIDASDVPNNPIQQLVDAMDATTRGHAALVWLNLEPDGYFLHFEPAGDRVRLRLDFASESLAANSRTIVTLECSKSEALLPLWRFVRKFQSCGYREPHWPDVDYHALDDIERRIKHSMVDQTRAQRQEKH
jgi:hypothetical protein